MNTMAITKAKRKAMHANPTRSLAPQRRLEVLHLAKEAPTTLAPSDSDSSSESRFRYRFNQTAIDLSSQPASLETTPTDESLMLRRRDTEKPKENINKPTQTIEGAKWNGWDSSCSAAPASTPIQHLEKEINKLIIVAELSGLKLAPRLLRLYLSGQATSAVEIPTEYFLKNELFLSHLGPTSNPNPREQDIRRLISNKVGVEDVTGEHHVAFMGGALSRLENHKVQLNSDFQLSYKDSLSWYKKKALKHPELAFGIGGGTIESIVIARVVRSKGDFFLRYSDWWSWVTDDYDFHAGDVARFPNGVCVPDSDLRRFITESKAKPFSTYTSRIDHPLLNSFKNRLFRLPAPTFKSKG